MRKFARLALSFAVAVLVASAAVTACLGATPRTAELDGYVLYRQSFSDVSSPETSGVRKGTSGQDGFDLSVSDGALAMHNSDELRSYVLFPYVDKPENYTVEFSFRFSSFDSANGYLGYMLTSRGDAPENVTAVTMRVDGKCGDFGTLPSRMMRSFRRGEVVSVSIPVENDTLHQITVSSSEVEKTLILENVVDIVDGSFGFVARNASVEILELSIIKGVEFDEKVGPYTKVSTWTDANPCPAELMKAPALSYEYESDVVEAEDGGESTPESTAGALTTDAPEVQAPDKQAQGAKPSAPTAPQTGDGALFAFALSAASAVVLCICRKRCGG